MANTHLDFIRQRLHAIQHQGDPRWVELLNILHMMLTELEKLEAERG